MKRTGGLITLLAISLGNSVAQLVIQSKKIATLEEDVANTLLDTYRHVNDHHTLENVPEWLGESFVTCARHYQDFGVDFFYLKTAIYFLTIASVILMFLRKKSGYNLYLIVQLITLLAIFYGLGFSSVPVIIALVSALFSVAFIVLYKKLFLKPFLAPKSITQGNEQK